MRTALDQCRDFLTAIFDAAYAIGGDSGPKNR